MNPVETYLTELRDIRAYNAHVEETTFYGTLETLLNEIGKSLKPKVRCIINPRNEGAGIPDGGLFTPDQKNTDMIGGQVPSRGVVEVKGIRDEVPAVIATEQVLKYLRRYAQVLVTNYRDFALVGRDDAGNPVTLESFRLAESADDFKAKLAHPRKLSQEIEAEFTEFLMRSLLRAADLTEPRDVAWVLASYARVARGKVEQAELPALDAVRTALEEALGLKFEGEKGEHFFRSTLVQTLFYGVFSAWVLWAKDNRDPGPEAKFDWRMAAWYLHVPMIGALFAQVATKEKLGDLGLMEVLDSAGAALNRVKRGPFFEKFEEQHAVQYFYEPFLEAFDPELRKQLGVWYTPPEIVEYMVERVDAVLREELHIEGGLANPQVYVLDPACGTGAYLVEVLRRIERTIREEQGEDAVAGAMVKLAATERVFGFEILPAPFVVAHLQLGLMLKNIGAELSDEKNERAGVYLTNSLTGWEPPTGPKTRIMFPEMEQEREAADRVKRDVPILVILGNPPYNGYAGMAVSEERELSTAYRDTKRAPKPQGQGLNDLYIRFFRMAERRIVEGTQKGVVCFISNYSWLDGLSFTGMRERYLEVFDEAWIDNLHGDRIISEYAPDGRTSETVFAMAGTSPGIKIGTAIALLVKKDGESGETCELHYRDLDEARADDRRRALLTGLKASSFDESYATLEPVLQIGLPFKPRAMGEDYITWPLLTDLFPVSFPGVKTSRDDVVVDIDRDRLVKRMEQYFDPEISHEEMRRISPGAMESTARFKAETVRDQLRKRGFLAGNVLRYCYRPFDSRWLYWEPETKLLDEKRSEYTPHVSPGNEWLSAGQRNRKMDFYQPQFTTHLADHHLVESNVGMFPIFIMPTEADLSLFADADIRANLTSSAQQYLDDIHGGVGDLFHHTLAILHSPNYRKENAGALRQDWPRIPLPNTSGTMYTSADLGEQLAALLDTESPVAGVTAGTLRPEIKVTGVISREGGGNLNPDTDFAVTVGWGHAGQGGVTMPARGKAIEREYTSDERAAIVQGAGALGITSAEAFAHLGETTFDIYLNNTAYWKNVPARVWDYHIGGYQVIKKWLSYREEKLLGRPLRLEEVEEVRNMARRIAGICLLEPSMDRNYTAVKADTYAWPG